MGCWWDGDAAGRLCIGDISELDDVSVDYSAGVLPALFPWPLIYTFSFARAPPYSTDDLVLQASFHTQQATLPKLSVGLHPKWSSMRRFGRTLSVQWP